MNSLLVRLCLLIIRCYKRVVSPMLGNHCRFHPSCSDYAAEALQTHGLIRGGWLALSRVLRCSPLTQGGVDPVPPVSSTPPQSTSGGIESLRDSSNQKIAASTCIDTPHM